MSHTETHIGKAIRLEMPQDKEVWAENTLKELKEERDDYYETAFEQVTQGTEWYIIVKDTLYFLDDKELDDDAEEAVLQSNGDIHYVTRFYNGGCGFTEAIESLLERAE